jgi:hypothetical protein
MTGSSYQRMRSALLISTAIVASLGVGAEVVHYAVGIDSPLVPLLSLSEEANLPTWYSSMLLFSCAAALAAIAIDARRSGGRFMRHWAVLAAVFLYMSLDETAQLHERLNSLWSLRGVFYFSWIIPVGIIVLLLGLAYLRFLIHLPAPTRWRFVIAGVLYVGGALVMEMPLGVWATRHGEDNLGYMLIDAVEESLEMFGATLFLLALVRHHETQRPATTARVAT